MDKQTVGRCFSRPQVIGHWEGQLNMSAGDVRWNPGFSLGEPTTSPAPDLTSDPTADLTSDILTSDILANITESSANRAFANTAATSTTSPRPNGMTSEVTAEVTESASDLDSPGPEVSRVPLSVCSLPCKIGEVKRMQQVRGRPTHEKH